MTQRRQKSGAGAAVVQGVVDVDVPGPAAPPARSRGRLEGLAYYLVAVPVWFVASWCALLLIELIERRLFGKDDA